MRKNNPVLHKTLLLTGAGIVLSGCQHYTLETCYVGIDVSMSARKDYQKNIDWIEQNVKSIKTDRLVIFVFADKCYEVYNDVKPQKDRVLEGLVADAVKTGQANKWGTGTKIENLIDFLSRRQKTEKQSRMFCYTDGYFEKSSCTVAEANTKFKELWSHGLKEVDFIGVDLSNKEKIYDWFDNSEITVKFVNAQEYPQGAQSSR